MSKKTVRVKLRCDQTSNFVYGQMAAFKHVNPEMGKKGPDLKHENTKMTREIPAATLEMQIALDSPQYNFFKPGSEYYFDITPAPAPKKAK